MASSRSQTLYSILKLKFLLHNNNYECHIFISRCVITYLIKITYLISSLPFSTLNITGIYKNNLCVNLTACPARHVPIAPLALCVVVPVFRLVRITSLLWRFVTGCGRRRLGGGEDTGVPASRTHDNLPEEQKCRKKIFTAASQKKVIAYE